MLNSDREAGNLDNVFLIRVLSVDDDESMQEARDEYVHATGHDRNAYRKMLDFATAGHEIKGSEGVEVAKLVTRAEGMELIKACIDGSSLSVDARKNYESQHTSLVESSASDAGTSAATE